jgi:copper chaperone CopZ
MRQMLLSLFAGLTLLPASSAVAAPRARVTLTIKGMTCGGCVAAVKLQLKKTEGVTAYEVSLEKGQAEVTYDPSRTDPEKIAASVSKTGFQATVKQESHSAQVYGPTSPRGEH